MGKNARVKLNRPGVKSVFAFFLLPQFWRCFGHFSHIGPTFVRTLALMLEQAGLLPINHPATRYYGAAADGSKITVLTIMGEAWFHLRTRKDIGFYQWGMFSSIVMMFAIFIGAVAVSIFYVISGTVAEAQLFTLVDGSGGAVATDMNTVPNIGAGMVGFDSSDPNRDLAIGLLDKVLRQGALGRGGELQNGIAAMYGTYSAAVLIVAAILVFWSIVSIIFDTARTGQIGGGRHNMVWTPIRFVFALGLLVPLGGGFSSGQHLVMKLAEMGSNLGSNMWRAYITSSLSGGGGTQSAAPDLLPPDTSFVTDNNAARAIIEPYIDAITCMKKENIRIEVSNGGNLTGPDVIRQVPAAGAIGTEFDKGKDSILIKYGSESDHAKCGSFSITNPRADFLTNAAADDAVANFKKLRRTVEFAAFNMIRGDIENYACAVAAKENPANPASYSTTCPNINMTAINIPWAIPSSFKTPLPACNPTTGGWGGTLPAKGCRERIVAKYAAYLQFSNYGNGGSNSLAQLRNYVNGSGGGASLINDITDDGWAGMGAWYFNIAKINRVAASSQAPGNNSSGKKEADSNPCPTWFISEEGFICQMMKMASSFWNTAQSDEKWSEIQKAFTSGGFMKSMFNIMKDGNSVLLVDMGGWGQNVHPISQIAQTGSAIFQKSLSMYNMMMLLALFAAIPWVGGAAEAILASPIGALLGTFAAFGMVPGIILLYYVPLIPWVRVTFAVLAWLVSVVEAVTTMPIVALAHLRTDGDGLAGPMARAAYITWLNLLLRPGLTVIGFVMGGLIFQAMVLYANDTFTTAVTSMGTGSFGIVDQIMNTYFYVMVVYALVNASFKLVDIIPNSTLSWLNAPGAQDFSNEDHVIIGGIQSIGGEFAQALSSNIQSDRLAQIGGKTRNIAEGVLGGGASYIRNRLGGGGSSS